MKPSEAIQILNNAGSEYSKKTAQAVKCLIDEYEAQKVRQLKLERALHGVLKDVEGIDKIIQTRKANDTDNLQNFLAKGESC